MNLLQAAGGAGAPNYYCTWNTQNFGRYDAVSEPDGRVFMGQEGAKKARDFLDEQHLVEPGGLLDQYHEVRGDLYFLLDDGWDVPYGVHPTDQIERFGSLEVAEDRFPSCTGMPAQRLAALSALVIDRGWRGLGLWVAAQAAGETGDRRLSPPQSDAYWSERLRWSRQAGIAYWKVDWGCRQFEPEWRENLNRLQRRLYPELVIEHCWPAAAPVNHVEIAGGRQTSSGRFADWGDWPAKWAQTLRCSAVFRTYDVLPPFSQLSTLDRIATLVKDSPQADGILNCEDEIYIAAAMGWTMGVMRSAMNKDIPVFRYDPQGLSHRTGEVIRAVRWQRLAPPFPISQAVLWTSDEIVSDSYRFEAGETWMDDYVGQDIRQACPSIVCRGIRPDGVDYPQAEKPILVASRHPNGAVAVAALPRTFAKDRYVTPPAIPAFSGISPAAPVAAFGYFGGLCLTYTGPIADRHVWAQDLAADTAQDLTEVVTIQGNTLFIPGEWLARIGTAAGADRSEPGCVVCLR